MHLLYNSTHETTLGEKDMKNIFIIGPYGAGKSSVGFQISKILKLPFYDSDREIENRSGVDIEWMFAIEGESGFRARELQIIKDLSKEEGVIIATGGGTVVIPECREILRNKGTIVYLQVPFEEQLSRIKRFPAKRPTLDNHHPEEKLNKLNKEREELYKELAHVTYVNTGKYPRKLAQKIVHDLKKMAFVGDS
jgi:shikimate kinase